MRRFGGAGVRTIPTPHDARDGVCFVVEAEHKRLGILTDLGHVFPGLEELIRSLDAVILESNYEPDLLERGPYPPYLKARIRGPRGHLSNVEAADLLARCGRNLRWAALGHLSEQNNSPDVALRRGRQAVGDVVCVHLASRYEPTALMEV